MDSFNPLNSVARSGTNFDTLRLIMLMFGAFFFGALTAAVHRGIKEQGWLGFKKPSRTTQTKEQMQRLEDIANNANDSE